MLGLCPKCNSEVLEATRGYYCRSPKCNFTLGGAVSGHVLNPLQVSKLLRDGRTEVFQDFVSESGRPFAARLVLSKSGQLECEPHRKTANEAGTPLKGVAGREGRVSDECRPLLDAASPELFNVNAFRITGLPVDATAREIAKHADKLKMMEELGQGEAAHTAAFALNPPPTVDQIRNAIQKLKDPEQRLVDELFWFWPERFGQGASDPSIRALADGDCNKALEIWGGKETDPIDGVVAMHNIALFWHLAALEWENYSKGTELSGEQRREVEQHWRNAFKRWEHLAVDDLFLGTSISTHQATRRPPPYHRVRSTDAGNITAGAGQD